MVYIDCPGFCDSKGVEANIVNSYFISKMTQEVKKAKFLIIIDGVSFHGKGVGDAKGLTYK